jgi:hypothetical protein
MTEWRWRKAGILPEPVQVRKRNYYRREDLMSALRDIAGTSA